MGVLSGYKILDLTTVVLGPLGTQLLGDMGADVIKIEPPGGDIIRHACPEESAVGAQGPPLMGMGPIFMTMNRNKRSLGLDLKKDAAKQILTRLIKTADVIIHNIRAGGMRRLGFDYDSVKKIKNDIIYVHAVGFGSGGRFAGFQAYDDLVQAASGMADLLPRQNMGQESENSPRYFPGLIADKTTGLYMANATLAGLLHRERTGKGQFIEVPMLECMVSFNMAENLFGHCSVPPNGPPGYIRSITPSRKPYPTKDGYIAIMPYSDENWHAFFHVAGRPELAEDERFKKYAARTKNYEQLYAIIAELAPMKTTQDWLETLRKVKVPAMLVHTLQSVLNEPHLRQTGFISERDHPDQGKYLSIGHPIQYQDAPAGVERDPPQLGQHNEAILLEIGMSDEEIDLVNLDGALHSNRS